MCRVDAIYSDIITKRVINIIRYKQIHTQVLISGKKCNMRDINLRLTYQIQEHVADYELGGSKIVIPVLQVT